jgi:hypothetical protein
MQYSTVVYDKASASAEQIFRACPFRSAHVGLLTYSNIFTTFNFFGDRAGTVFTRSQPCVSPPIPICQKSSKSVEPQSQHPQRPEITGRFNHFLLDIWDLYIEMPPAKSRIPFYYPLNADKALLVNDLQYLWKALYDLSGPLLFVRLAVSAALALSLVVSLLCVSSVT